MTDIRAIIKDLKAWFPPEAHKERDLPGGGKWMFVPWSLIRERLDEVYPEWQVEYSQPLYLGDYCTITCTITIAGISKQGVGNAEIMLLSSSGKNMARGTPIERATADAFKNAAEAWGVARYLDEQTDPKTKQDFVRYMQRSGDGRAATYYHQNEGNLPKKSAPSSVKAKPFGAGSVAASRIDQPPQAEQPNGMISEAQRKRFWAIAKKEGEYSDEAFKALLEQEGIASSKDIPIGKYDDLCRKAADKELGKAFNEQVGAVAVAAVESGEEF